MTLVQPYNILRPKRFAVRAVWVCEGLRNIVSINTITIGIVCTTVIFKNCAKYARRLHAAQSSDPKGIQQKIPLHFAWHGVLPLV